MRKFYCALKTANPAARVYIYETWANLQGNGPRAADPPAHRFDWFAEMNTQRENWRRLADAARKPNVAMPGRLSRFGLTWRTDAGCKITDPIYAVPVGEAFVAIARRIQAPQTSDVFELPSGPPLALTDLFANPYVDWPQSWPITRGGGDIDPAAVVATLTLRDAAQPHDDIHLSVTGIYVAGLVHFATLYRQSPVGLPSPPDIGDAVARTLQHIVWETVRNEPRTGVDANAGGGD